MDKSHDERKRYGFFDFGRGVLMIFMALDHASKFYNTGRLKSEGLQGFYPPYIDKGQIITRLLGNIAAPGFIFTFGTMVAISSFRRSQQFEDQWAISRYLINRGLFLIFLQFVVMSRLTIRFEILYCIGCLMILLAFLRRTPPIVIIFLSTFSIMILPYLSYTICPSNKWEQYLLEATITPSKHGLYPFLPWFGMAGIGCLFGTYFIKKWSHFGEKRLAGKFAVISATFMLFFLIIRLMNKFGNLHMWRQFSFGEFFLMSKYPPSPAFLFWNMSLFFGILAIYIILSQILPDNKTGWLHPGKIIELYGKVPLFFYILHLYLYEGIAVIFNIQKSLSLLYTYLLWLVGLIVLYPPCASFHRLKRYSPNNSFLRML